MIHNSKSVETTQMSMDRWTQKMWYIHTTEHYLALKVNSGTCYNMNFEDIMLSQISCSQKDKYYITPNI